VILFTGPLAGTCVATTARTVVCTRSPATSTILDSYVGGSLGAELKFAGYDGLIVTGKAPKPSYLLIRDGDVGLRDASAVWGKGIWDTENWLKEQVGDSELKTIAAGPAGENLVTFACLTSEAYRQAGRGGLGAVFGSKNLKAIAVRGTGGVTVPDMSSFLALYRDIYVNANINADAIRAAKIRDRACLSCPLACGKLTQYGNRYMEGPEYETLALTASNCGIGDLSAVIAFNQRCDDLGLDTISTGNVIGLALAMTAEGRHDFGLRFGDVEAYLGVVEDIAFRQGVGAELAEGARKLARKYGGEALVLENKGLEYPGYDPRGSYGMALAYATSERGACHLRSFAVGVEAFGDIDPFTLEGKAQLVIRDQNRNSVKWTGIFCDFWAIEVADIAQLIAAATGHPYQADEMMTIGERIWNLGRLFNVREGFSRADDYPPPAIFERPLPTGAAAGKNLVREEYEAALDEYYRLRGWTPEGCPTPEKLEDLGLGELAS
jgi:aldehyde:ferredoxin oxidoreductase